MSLHTRPFQIFVNYIVSQEDEFILANLQYFLEFGVTEMSNKGRNIVYYITLNGLCPHSTKMLKEYNEHKNANKSYVNIHQRRNIGFDFGAHGAAVCREAECCENHSLCDYENKLNYDAFIFLNCGVRGPFYPVYMPSSWHWSDAFIDGLSALQLDQTQNKPSRKQHGENVALLGTSLVCLDEPPAPDGGGIGPRIEGFAFALTKDALVYALENSTSFNQHPDKVEAIVYGEYAISQAILSAPNKKWNIGSFLLEHEGVDFRLEKNWNCNNKTFPSREFTYGPGITINPLEVLFHKGRWRGLLNYPNLNVMEFYTDFSYENQKRKKKVHNSNLFVDEVIKDFSNRTLQDGEYFQKKEISNRDFLKYQVKFNLDIESMVLGTFIGFVLLLIFQTIKQKRNILPF